MWVEEVVQEVPQSRSRSGNRSKYAGDLLRISQMAPGTKLKITDKEKEAVRLRSALPSAAKTLKVRNLRFFQRGDELYIEVL